MVDLKLAWKELEIYKLARFLAPSFVDRRGCLLEEMGLRPVVQMGLRPVVQMGLRPVVQMGLRPVVQMRFLKIPCDRNRSMQCSCVLAYGHFCRRSASSNKGLVLRHAD